MEKTITSLEIQKKNPNRISVYLDDEFAFGVSRFVGAWLRTGEKISEESISQIIGKDEREKALQKALHFINYRARSASEVKVKLSEQGFSDETVKSVLQELNEKDYVNDQTFAVDWIDSRSRSKPRSRRMYRYELRKKNIDEFIIDEVLEKAPTDEDLARRLGEKYLRLLNHLDDEKFRKKMEGVFARRAFPFSVIKTILRELINRRNEEKESLRK